MPDFWAYHTNREGKQLGITGPHPTREAAIEAGKAKFPGKDLSHGYGANNAHFDIRHTAMKSRIFSRPDSAEGLEAPGTSGARSDADEAYWTYKAASPTPERPPPGSPMSLTDWHSLSPGMRREIWRSEPKARTDACSKLDACVARIDNLNERCDRLGDGDRDFTVVFTVNTATMGRKEFGVRVRANDPAGARARFESQWAPFSKSQFGGKVLKAENVSVHDSEVREDAAMSSEEREAVVRFLAARKITQVGAGVSGLEPGYWSERRYLASEREAERHHEREREQAFMRPLVGH